MKRKLLVLLSILSLSIFAACGVSHADYDSIVAENEKLKDENTSLSEQVEKLQDEKLEIAKNAVALVSETTESQKQDFTLEYNNKYVKLITDQIYGGNCDISISDNHLYINVFYPQEYSYELYKKMLEDCANFASLYTYTRIDAPDDILSFDFVSVSCYDSNSIGVTAVSYTPNDDVLEANEIMLGTQHLTDMGQHSSE